MRVHITGATGRLGSVIADTFVARGDELCAIRSHLNYLVFSHRYRGVDDYQKEMDGNLTRVIKAIESTTWHEDDCGIVIISSVSADTPDTTQSLAYNLSKAALNQAARYYAKKLDLRVNTVSPATFSGDQPAVSKQEVANVVAFLCSPLATGINGQNIKVTGNV